LAIVLFYWARAISISPSLRAALGHGDWFAELVRDVERRLTHDESLVEEARD